MDQVVGGFAGTTRINGSFTIDYDAVQSFNKITASSVFVNGTKLSNAVYQEATNAAGTVTYRPLFVSELSNTSSQTSLTLNYNGQTPSAFVNAEVNVSYRDYSVFPTTSQFGTYQTQQLAVSTVPVCFDSGTLIKTTNGYVAVEDLRVGDRAVTASGTVRPIVWIGHRDLAGQGGALPHAQQPVRVSAGAFGDGLPTRDLTLSPGHPVLVGADDDAQGGHLVPIMCLINGTTIVRLPLAAVTYWHVELDAHDILLAEGLAAESYIDGGDRPFFAQASDHALHNPDIVAPGWSARCRPVAVDGPRRHRRAGAPERRVRRHPDGAVWMD